MKTSLIEPSEPTSRAAPLCPVFGTCGGCAYQDLSYEEELALKERNLRAMFHSRLEIREDGFAPIVASPEPYHYRSRLDLSLKRSRQSGMLLGFQKPGSRRMVEVDACAIALPGISNFLPQLKAAAAAKLPADYRHANLVVKSGDGGEVLWGGIGRRSLELDEKDYLWTEIRGKRIFYSLDVFFQANLSILPALMDQMESLAQVDRRTLFLDLYAGVGLFGIYFGGRAGKVVMIEENAASLKLMRWNAAYHGLHGADIRSAKVETELPALMETLRWEGRRAAVVDPPRRGLSPQVREILGAAGNLDQLLYLSCNPETLLGDLKFLTAKGWNIRKVVPFDFFPKTVHLETLVLLTP